LPYVDILYLFPFLILGLFFRNPPDGTRSEEARTDPASDARDDSVPVVQKEEVLEEEK
jgi:hypothetical protein